MNQMPNSKTQSPAGIAPLRVKPGMKMKILADRDIERIHEASLTVLQERGVRFPLQKGLDIFAEAGADVDFTKQVVRISPELLLKTINRAPRNVRLGSRSGPELDVVLDGEQTYFGTSGTGTRTMDLDSGERRESCKQDVADMALITDYLPSISFYWPMVSALDCPAELLALHEIEASFLNTRKHVSVVTCVEKKAAEYAVEMAATVAGSPETLRRRPPLSLVVSPVSPLNQDAGAIEAALVFAEAGLPIEFASMPIMGSTAPASIPGALVVGNAEILSAICLIQLAAPGAPMIYPMFSGVMNPFTGGCLVSSDMQHLFYACTVQLGHFYNLPVMSTYGGSDLAAVDSWKTGRDESIDAFFITSTGPDMLPCLGLMECYTLLCPEKILFDNDIFESVRFMSEGIEVNRDSLTLDDILEVGPGGHFMDRQHTVRQIRGNWDPGIAYHWSKTEKAFRQPRQAAIEQVKWILKHHRPEPLGDSGVELKRILDSAQKEYKV